MNRKVRNISLAAAALLLLGAAGFVVGGAVVARRFPARIPEAATLAPRTVPRPGDAAQAEAVLNLPWGCAVAAVKVEAGTGAVVSGEPRISSRWRWGYRVWRIGATLRPLGTAGAAPGKFVLALEDPPAGYENGRCEIAIPAVPVAKSDGGAVAEKPRLADPETLRKTSIKWRIVAAAVALVILLAAAVLVIRRKKRELPPPPPWQVALSALDALETDMKKRAFRAENGVWQLSDILRNYLAARFELAAVTATDEEFLDTRAVEALDREDRKFLRDFFAAALPVKFARMPADPAELERSVAAARRLVERTVPPPEPSKNNAEARS